MQKHGWTVQTQEGQTSDSCSSSRLQAEAAKLQPAPAHEHARTIAAHAQVGDMQEPVAAKYAAYHDLRDRLSPSTAQVSAPEKGPAAGVSQVR